MKVGSDSIHNHPVQPTLFVGRKVEIAEITERLASPACRLLSLVGPGGIGKTRLALQAAIKIQDFLADGVHFVPLQSIASTEFLASAIADVLTFPLSGQDDPDVQLLSYLRNKEMLLVLDNFEHLLEGVKMLSAILATAPAVKLLITSREVLNLQEEWLYPIQGLPYPEHDDHNNPERCDAVQLFVERTRQVCPEFSLIDEEAEVVRICQLVEGVPLAIELAASWTRTLRCQAIGREIRRNLDFLATRLRNIPDRHRSMQAVFDYSWSRLREEEREVFKRLSLFHGGFRRAAAKRVAGASLAILTALVDKSLLRREPDGRYHIHELLRQYAEEKLEDASQIRDLHCHYYTDFLQDRTEDVLGGRQRDALAEIEPELENVRAAWQWAVETVNIEGLHKAATTLYLFYHFRSRYREAADAFAKAAASLDRAEPSGKQAAILANLQVMQGWFYIRLGRFAEAKAVLEKSRALYSTLGIPPLPGHATDPLIPLGIIATIEGDYRKAAKLGEEARRVSEGHNHPWNRKISQYLLTRAALAQGEYEKAQQHAQQAYAVTQRTGDQWFMAYCLNELGNVACALGDYTTAKEHYRFSYSLREAFGDPEGMAVALNHLGKVALLQEAYAEAEELYQQSLAIYQEISDKGGLAISLEGLGRTACALGDYRAARKHFQQALEIAAEIRFMSLILSLLIGIAELLLKSGQPERGVELLIVPLHHPASDYETVARVRQLLTQYEKEIPQELVARTTQVRQVEDVEMIVAQLLVALAAPWEEIEALPSSTGSFDELPEQPLIDPLTPRELEVLHLLADGLSYSDIAEELVIAVGTVKSHTHNIYSKLAASNRVQAVTQAKELHLL